MKHRTFRETIVRLCAAISLAALLAAPPLAAQGGGFTAGDLYLYSQTITGSGYTDCALVHVDLSAGTATIHVDTMAGFAFNGAVAFDPYRQRLIFCGAVNSSADPVHLYLADGAGTLTDLGQVGQNLHAFAPTGDGRIYMHQYNNQTAPLHWLDAAGTRHTLLDATGTLPFKLEGTGAFGVEEMLYDAGTNALFVASGAAFGTCPGSGSNGIQVHKLPLSPDGSRVIGPVSCAGYDVDPASNDSPVGLSRTDGGQLLLVVDINNNGPANRMLLVDPATLAITVFANNNHGFSAATNAGTWSSALGKAVILDTGNNVLRAFAQGESGAGAIIPLLGPVSATGGSGEMATLIEVRPSPCDGAFLAFGSGLAGKGGFVPTLTGSGCPEIGGAFSLQFGGAVGSASGMLFVGLSKLALPFKGGTFYIGNIVVAAPFAVGGAPGVAGAGSLSIPAALPNNPVLIGLDVFLQAGYADLAAVKGTSLTQGLDLEIG